MPAEQENVHSLSIAEIIGSIYELIDLHQAGVLDVSDNIATAVGALEECRCESVSDALALISLSRRLTQSIVADLVKQKSPDPLAVFACDNFMETALAFLKRLAADPEHSVHTVH